VITIMNIDISRFDDRARQSFFIVNPFHKGLEMLVINKTKSIFLRIKERRRDFLRRISAARNASNRNLTYLPHQNKFKNHRFRIICR
jgi:hypothetical protein